MPVAGLFASHTPLKAYAQPGAAVAAEVAACFDTLRAEIADFAPERVVVVGPDHFNGFFYRLMPSFCIGAAAASVGDWNTPSGPLPVDAPAAEACVAAAHRGGVDVALSWQMDLDHGITQILDELFDFAALPPVVPVFVNCAAPPLPPLPRVVALGRVLGCLAREWNERTLIIASGGLSHDPPIPRLADAPAAVRKRIVEGGHLDPQARAARQQRVLDEARAQTGGSSTRTPLNPAWDEAFMDGLARRDFDGLCAMDDDGITAAAGCGGHELRAWLAVAAALDVADAGPAERRYYRAIPEWVAGFGVMAAGLGR